MMTVFNCVCLCLISSWLEQAGTVNVALNKPATQSSTAPYGNSVASNAVDGDTNGDWSKGSCTHTDDPTEQWWMVDLLQEYNITDLYIVNRQDDHSDELQNFVIEVYLSNPTVFPSANTQFCVHHGGEFPAFGTLYCRQPLTGRFVRIRKLSPFSGPHLMMCEVSVTGKEIARNAVCQEARRRFVKIEGQHLTASSAVTKENTSRAECAAKCMMDQLCQGFNFRDITRTCNVIKETIDSDVKAVDNDWDLYYM